MPSANHRRLTAMAAQIGVCQTHWESRICVSCDASEPMPIWAQEGINRFMDAVLARVAKEDIRLAMYRVTPPTTEPCPTCPGLMTCQTCTATYSKRLFLEIGLTPGETAELQTLMRKARAFENR